MKRLVWLGNSHSAIASFPAEARHEAGYQLYRVQEGLEPADWKALPALGAGIIEIRIHADNEYRVVYVAKFVEAIYVLHAFEKKTRQLSDHDASIAKKRFRELLRTRRGT
jgi:phage-related protein